MQPRSPSAGRCFIVFAPGGTVGDAVLAFQQKYHFGIGPDFHDSFTHILLTRNAPTIGGELRGSVSEGVAKGYWETGKIPPFSVVKKHYQAARVELQRKIDKAGSYYGRHNVVIPAIPARKLGEWYTRSVLRLKALQQAWGGIPRPQPGAVTEVQALEELMKKPLPQYSLEC